MSDPTAVPVIPAGEPVAYNEQGQVPDYGAGPQVAPQPPVFRCDVPGCTVVKDTQRKLNSHKGQAHKRYTGKKRVAQVLTPAQRQQASIPNFSPIHEIDKENVLLVDPKGRVWKATLLNL